MRRLSALLGILAVATAALVGVTPTPAHAAKTITATVPSGVGCPSGQVMTGAKFTLTKVTQGQKITVQTLVSALTRDHNSFAGGTAFYDVTFDARLANPSGPATASVADNNWNGTFQLTAASCKTHSPVAINAQGSTCGNSPQVSVRLNNTNSIMVAYQVGGNSLSGQTREVLGGRTEEVVFDNAERGKTYQVTAEGDDGTRSTASVEVPACLPPTTVPPSSAPPSPAPSSASPSASASSEPSESPSDDPFAEATTEPAPFTTPKTPKTKKSSLASNPTTWVGVGIVLLGAVLLAGLITARLVRRRRY